MQEQYITVDGIPVLGLFDANIVDAKFQEIQALCPNDLVMKHSITSAEHKARVLMFMQPTL